MDTAGRAGVLFLGLGVIAGGVATMYASIRVDWGAGGFLLVALFGYAALFLGYELILRAVVGSGAGSPLLAKRLGRLRSLFCIAVSGLLTGPVVFLWMLSVRSSPRDWSTAGLIALLVVVTTGVVGVVGLSRS